MARLTGLEPATPGVTGRYSNQLSYNRAAPNRSRLGCGLCVGFGGVKPILRDFVPGAGPAYARLQACDAHHRSRSLDRVEWTRTGTRARRLGTAGFGWTLRTQSIAGRWRNPLSALLTGRGVLGEWWAVRGSNPRPIRCKRIALPTELTAPGACFTLPRRHRQGGRRFRLLGVLRGPAGIGLSGYRYRRVGR